VLTLSECFDDESKAKEAQKDAVEFLEAGEDTTIAFESAKEPFDFIAFAIQGPVIVPGIDAIRLRGNDRNHLQSKN